MKKFRISLLLSLFFFSCVTVGTPSSQEAGIPSEEVLLEAEEPLAESVSENRTEEKIEIEDVENEQNEEAYPEELLSDEEVEEEEVYPEELTYDDEEDYPEELTYDDEEDYPEELPSDEEEKENIVFSGGRSSVVLRNGKERLSLSDGATVKTGSLNIVSEEVEIYGEDWRYVECMGRTVITDEEKGITITAGSLWYDRNEERILIPSWFEIDDSKNEVSASAAVLEYNLNDEILRLDKDVSLLRDTDDGIMRCGAESALFMRAENIVTLRGSAVVHWKGSVYMAEVITVNLDDDTISLEGRIRGDING